MNKKQNASEQAQAFAKEKHENLLQLKLDIELEPKKHKLPLAILRDLMECFNTLIAGKTYITIASETGAWFGKYSFLEVKARYLDYSIKYREDKQ